MTDEDQPSLFDPVLTRDLPALEKESRALTADAIQRVDLHADEVWKDRADAAIEALCRMRQTFTADDVWWFLEDAGVDPPREPRALGARMQAAVRQGRIYNTGRVVKSKRPETHGSWITEWAVVS